MARAACQRAACCECRKKCKSGLSAKPACLRRPHRRHLCRRCCWKAILSGGASARQQDPQRRRAWYRSGVTKNWRARELGGAVNDESWFTRMSAKSRVMGEALEVLTPRSPRTHLLCVPDPGPGNSGFRLCARHVRSADSSRSETGGRLLKCEQSSKDWRALANNV